MTEHRERAAMALLSVIPGVLPATLAGVTWPLSLTTLVPLTVLLAAFRIGNGLARRSREAARGRETALAGAAEVAPRERRASLTERALVVTGRGFPVDHRGVEIVEVGGEAGVPKAEVRDDEGHGIRGEEVGQRHVSVHLRTVWGSLEMPWLPRTGALVGALRAIASRHDLPWTPTFDAPRGWEETQ